MSVDLSSVRSVLFLPASNPRAIEKARHLPADLVILDLEDAVKPGDKDAARVAAVRALQEPWDSPVAVRINGVASEWHGADIEAVTHCDVPLIVLPRVDAADEARGAAELTGRPVLAMIETAAGVLEAARIAPHTVGLIAGTNDLSADLRLPPGAGRAPLQTALQTIVLAARAAGVAAFDGVYNNFSDADGFAAECEEGRQLGFDGKSVIHPSQVEPCNAAFSPTQAEIDHAWQIIGSFDGGAQRFEGEMIERMHVEAARRLLARARAT